MNDSVPAPAESGQPPNRPLRALLLAWLAIGTGTWALFVALAVHALDAFGPGAVGAVLAARLIPAMVAAPLMAHLADRHDRGRLVALAASVEALAFGGVAAAVLAGSSLVVLLVLVAIGGAAGTAPRPALEALMPALARTPDELTRTTALWSALDNGGFLVGAGVGGLLVAAIGAGEVIALAAMLIGLGAVAATTLPSVTATEADDGADEGGFLKELLGGIEALRESPSLRAPMLLFAGLLLLEGISDVLLIVLAVRELGMGNGGPGVLYAVWGAAGLLGSALTLMLLRRRGYGLALSVGALAHAAGLVAVGLDGVPLALAAVIPAGIGFALVEVGTMALVPRLADDAVLGRVFGLMEIIYAGLSGLGALIGPLLVSGLGVKAGLIVAASAYGLLALVTWSALARLDAGQEEAGRVRALLRGVPFLAPLPLPRLERLVRTTRKLSARQGEAIITRGEPGEDFYVVEDGTVAVADFGRRLGPGTSFGEIALLHDVPRTATVRAMSDVHMRVLGRTAFLAALGAHEDAHATAHTVAAERLANPEVG